jgi:hypothetical protein
LLLLSRSWNVTFWCIFLAIWYFKIIWFSLRHFGIFCWSVCDIVSPFCFSCTQKNLAILSTK